MKSKVAFAGTRSSSPKQNVLSKLATLVETMELGKTVAKGDLVAVKVHFGELGNDAFISPVYVRAIVDAVKRAGGKPFVTDTNTLYKGSRANSVDHLDTAFAHGFLPAVVGCPVIIADGLKSGNWREVPIEGRWFKRVKIASDILDADAIIAVSHVKGHEMAGFGGAIKNLAMGCAPAAGKRDQHSVKMAVKREKCVACGACVEVCPANAISLLPGGKAAIDKALCIGCGECLPNCRVKAISMDWDVELSEFMEKMTEYAVGAVHGKKDKALYVNFLTRIVPDCDCCGWSDTPVVPDLGLLASRDPVAIDSSSLDLITGAPVQPGSALDGKAGPGTDKFRALHPSTKGEIQLDYGEKLGLGTRDYELERI